MVHLLMRLWWGSGQNREEAGFSNELDFRCQNTPHMWVPEISTLFQSGQSEQVTHEITNYSIDILYMSEARWTGQRHLCYGDKTMLFSRQEEHHIRVVGIILSSYQKCWLNGDLSMTISSQIGSKWLLEKSSNNQSWWMASTGICRWIFYLF